MGCRLKGDRDEEFSMWVRHVVLSFPYGMWFPFEVQSRRKEVLEPHQLNSFFLHQCLCEGLPHFLPRPLQTAIPSFIRMAKPT